MNGPGSGWVTPSAVTWRSCIASSSAACVLAGARLTSSARTRLAKTGPGRNTTSRPRGSSTTAPVMSAGSRSGVNCTRANDQPGDGGQRAGDQRLGHAGQVVEQDVAVGQEAEQHELEHGALADDGPLQLVEHGAARSAVAASVAVGAVGHSCSRAVTSAGAVEAGRLAVEGGPQLGTADRRGPRRVAVEVDAVAVGEAGGGDAAARSAQGGRHDAGVALGRPRPWPGPRRPGAPARSASPADCWRAPDRLERRRLRRPARRAGSHRPGRRPRVAARAKQRRPAARWSGTGAWPTVTTKAPTTTTGGELEVRRDPHGVRRREPGRRGRRGRPRKASMAVPACAPPSADAR